MACGRSKGDEPGVALRAFEGTWLDFEASRPWIGVADATTAFVSSNACQELLTFNFFGPALRYSGTHAKQS